MAGQGPRSHRQLDRGVGGERRAAPRLARTVCGLNSVSHNLPARDQKTDLRTINYRELEPRTPASSIQAKDPPVLFPLEVMVHPLELRFKYHFSGAKPTNRLDKVRVSRKGIGSKEH